MDHDDRFGSQAALQANISSMSASGGKADVQKAEYPDFPWPLSASSKHIWYVLIPSFQRRRLSLH
jgi:hypothetical protein